MATYYEDGVQAYFDIESAADYLGVSEEFLYRDRARKGPTIPYTAILVYNVEVLKFVKGRLAKKDKSTNTA